jgi:hypothetical protein
VILYKLIISRKMVVMRKMLVKKQLKHLVRRIVLIELISKTMKVM